MPADPVAAVEAAFRAEGMKGDPEQIRRFAEAAVKVCERDTVRRIVGFLRDESVPTPPEWGRAAEAIEAEIGERDG